MENLNEIINFIARTNLFNFAIFLTIIIILLKKINVSKKLDDMAVKVVETVEHSEKIKEESVKHLATVEEGYNNLAVEIEDILQKSEENSKIVGTKILEDAQNATLIIKNNTEKSIENSLQLLKNDLIKRASLASIEVAKSHILSELERNEDLHYKLIDESIDSITNIGLEEVEQ